VLGSLAAWYLLSIGADVRRVIGWSVAPGLFALVVLAVVLQDRQATVDGASNSAGTDATGRIFWAPVTVLAALTFVRLPETLFLLYLQQRGLPIPLVPLVWAALHVVRSLSSYPGGRLADRLGASAGVAASGLLFAGTAAALALARAPGAAVAIFLVLGLATGLTEAAERSLIAALAPVKTGKRFGAYHGLTGFAALPAGLAFGLVYQSLGGSGALFLSAAGTIIAVMAWLIVAPQASAGARA
jgi:nitrate/nitrite transporter NarK